MGKIDYVDDDPLLDQRDLKERFPHLPNSKNQLRRLVAWGFPAAIKISERRLVWPLSAVVAYVERKKAEAQKLGQQQLNKAATRAKAKV